MRWSITVKCPSCNNSINDTCKFCPKCGFRTPGATYFVSDTSYLSWIKHVDIQKASYEKPLTTSGSAKLQATINPNDLDSLPKSITTPAKNISLPNTTSDQINSNNRITTKNSIEKEKSASDIGAYYNIYNENYNQKPLQNAILKSEVHTSSPIEERTSTTQQFNQGYIHQQNDNQQQLITRSLRAKRSKRNSIVCMICGIASVLLSLIGYFTIYIPKGNGLSFIFYIVAIICSVICLILCGKHRVLGGRNGFSRAGKVTGVIGLVFSITCGILCFFILFSERNIGSQTIKLPQISNTIIERIEKMDVVASGKNYTIYNEDFYKHIAEARWWDYDSTMGKPGVYNSDTKVLAFSIEIKDDTEDDIYFAYYYSKDTEFDKDDLSKPVFSDTIGPVEYRDGRVFYNVECSRKIQEGYYVVIVASDETLTTPCLVAYAEVN